jgi:hypothetical protein
MQVAIEQLENRRLMSSSPFGPITITPQPLRDEVVGQPLVNSRTSPDSGDIDFAVLDASGFNSSNAPQMVVHWGDGSAPLKSSTIFVPDTGRVVASLPFDSRHTYGQPGNYTVHVSFKYQNHTVAGFSKSVHVARNSPLGATLVENASSPFTASLGSFQGISTMAAQSAVIDWGDGQNSDATLANNENGQPAQVTGSHTYARPGRYQVSVAGTFVVIPPPGESAVASVGFQNMFSTIIVRRHR